MTVELLSLCDFAQDAFGKLTVIGSFDAITVRDFPAVHPLMCIAARIRFPVYELGNHPVHVELHDADGGLLAPALDGSLNVNGIGGDSACANLTLNLLNLRFEREGTWKATLSIDGVERASVPLYIRRAAPPHRPA